MTEEKLDTLDLTPAEVSLAQEWYQKAAYKWKLLPQDETLYKRMREFIEK